MEPGELRKRALIGVLQLQVTLVLLLFLPAWSWSFWEAWIYWGLCSLAVLFITLHFLKRDPALIESRLRAGPVAERQKSQQIIQAITSLLFCAVMIVPGIERRAHPAHLPWSVVLAADALVLVGYGIIHRVFQENGYASSIIEVKSGQRVISTGPYALVRHPMYSGGALMLLATPPALGSLWALGPAILLCGMIVARLVEEERYLVESLPGYEGYRRQTRHRLIPYLW